MDHQSCGSFPMGWQEIANWVEAHRDALPTTLAGISAYPIPFRKMIVNAVSVDVRIDLWSEHTRSFLDSTSDLSKQQRAILEELLEELPRIHLSWSEYGDRRSQEIHDSMRDVFTPQQIAAVLYRLGPAEPPGGLPLPS